MIIIRRVCGGHMVRIRHGVPPVFIADNAVFNRSGVVADRRAVIDYIERVWWMST